MSVKVVIVVRMHLSLQNKSHCSVIFNNAQHVKKAFGYIFYRQATQPNYESDGRFEAFIAKTKQL